MTKNHVVYIGKDSDFFNQLKTCMESEFKLIDFFENNLSIASLVRTIYGAIIMDCQYKGSLAIMEAIRSSVDKDIMPYILLVGNIQELKAIKNQLTIRNYPDDISLKNIHPACIVNQLNFVIKSSEEIKKEAQMGSKEVIKGELKTSSYGKLIFNLYEANFTGKLLIESLSEKAVIKFFDGKPVEVKFNKIQFTLGRILLKKGLLSEENYLKSLDIMVKEGKRHGDALISLNLLKPSDIADAIREQFYEKLAYFFSKEQGDYLIVKEEPEVFNFSYPKIDIYHLIYDGIKRYAPIGLLMNRYIDFKENYIAIKDKFTLLKDKIPFDNLEKEMLDYLSEPKRFIEILEQFAKDYNTVFRVIETLISFDMISFAENLDMAKEISSWANPKMIEIKESIMKDYVDLKEKNYYEILGISFDADEKEIKKRYLELAKKYHPDRYSHIPLTRDLLTKINETFQIVQTAYNVLSNKSSRESYDQTIKSPIIKEMMEKTENIVNAEIAFKKGEFFLKRRDYKNAHLHLKEAVKLYDKEPEYLVSYAIASIFLKNSEEDGYFKEARKALEKAVYINPYYEKSYYYLGILNKLEGRSEEAKLCFKKVLNINPDNKEAYLELKSLEKI